MPGATTARSPRCTGSCANTGSRESADARPPTSAKTVHQSRRPAQGQRVPRLRHHRHLQPPHRRPHRRTGRIRRTGRGVDPRDHRAQRHRPRDRAPRPRHFDDLQEGLPAADGVRQSGAGSPRRPGRGAAPGPWNPASPQCHATARPEGTGDTTGEPPRSPPTISLTDCAGRSGADATKFAPNAATTAAKPIFNHEDHIWSIRLQSKRPGKARYGKSRRPWPRGEVRTSGVERRPVRPQRQDPRCSTPLRA